MDSHVIELLERSTKALEALAREPEITLPAFPAVCPHCETMNPIVRVSESENVGKLAGFVIKGDCLNCNHTFYALPMQWICVATMEEAEQADAERAEHSGYDQG